MSRQLTVAVVGAGIGGLAVAATLERVGIDAVLFEQASAFARIGAGIQMAPNAMKVLRAIGIAEELERVAFQPDHRMSRVWDTGEITNQVPYGRAVRERYGEPYLYLHRGDLHALLAEAARAERRVRLGKTLASVDAEGGRPRLHFADGTSFEADLVIAADGVHSPVREQLFSNDGARFTGRIAYRTVYPRELLRGAEIDPSCKWWGTDRHIVIYPISAGREIYFTTSTPSDGWDRESWSAQGDVEQVRAEYAGFHPTVQTVLEACPAVQKWAIYERTPLPTWRHGERIVLLGDACHPMTPYMAQGAAMAIEDAAVLSRCLDGTGDDARDLEAALETFETMRKPRTSQMQQTSGSNTWMHYQTNPDWVWGYDAWREPLGSAAVG